MALYRYTTEGRVDLDLICTVIAAAGGQVSTIQEHPSNKYTIWYQYEGSDSKLHARIEAALQDRKGKPSSDSESSSAH